MRLSRAQLEKAITEAMKWKAPSLFRELSENGGLEAEVTRRADQAEEDYELASSEAEFELLTVRAGKPELPYMEKVQKMQEIGNRTWREALEQACEFPIEEEPNEQSETISEISWTKMED